MSGGGPASKHFLGGQELAIGLFFFPPLLPPEVVEMGHDSLTPGGSHSSRHFLEACFGKYSHEASSSGNHDVLDIWKRLKLGGALEDRRLLPDAIVLKEAVSPAI